MTTLLAAPWLLPPDERERLDTLHRYATDSCLHEPVFDGFVDLAARIFSLPVAFISLVDADEITYKANHGLPQLLRQPRMSAICALTVRHNAPLLFTDLREPAQHSKLTAAALQAIHANNVQFYVSLPLRMPDQRPIGTFCLLGHHARAFSPPEQRVLEQLAEPSYLPDYQMAGRRALVAYSDYPHRGPVGAGRAGALPASARGHAGARARGGAGAGSAPPSRAA
jgi:hypothetical protein